MEKVKVSRYISGKVPEYARDAAARHYDSDSDSSNSDSESGEEEQYYLEPARESSPDRQDVRKKDVVHDRRLARLLQRSIPSTTMR